MPNTSITKVYQGRAAIHFNEGRHSYLVYVNGRPGSIFQPSVTGIISQKNKPALVGWAAKQSLKYVAKKLAEYESAQGAPPFNVDTSEIHQWIAEAEDAWRELDNSTTIGTIAHRFAYEELRFRAGLTKLKPKLPIEIDPVLMPDFTPEMVDAVNSSARAALQWFDTHHIEPILLERPLWSCSEGYVGTPDGIAKIDGELAIFDFKSSKALFPEVRLQLAALQNMYQEEFPNQVIKTRWAVNIPKTGGDVQTGTYGLDEYSEDLEAFRACLALYHFTRKTDPYAKGAPVTVLGQFDALVARQ
ncbi:MAG TPA: hypothetical protein VI386_17745 [Candidatus Sulfotelmatobacter sp.]